MHDTNSHDAFISISVQDDPILGIICTPPMFHHGIRGKPYAPSTDPSDCVILELKD
jgi:hypothetical protein